MMMMMIAIINLMLSVALTLLLTINAASIHNLQLQVSHELANGDYQLDNPALPRKLMVNNKVEEGYDTKDVASFIGQNKAFAAKIHMREEEKVMGHAAKGTRQEWIEGSDPNHEFFTMDYSHVRRRRPIHNKSFPNTLTNSP